MCSVAVLDEDRVPVEMTLVKPRSHSEHLAPMIKTALSYAAVSVQSLSGIVVSKGPGSYTGLRIGVSAAKGLAFSQGIDLIGVPSLEVLASEALSFAEAGDIVLCAFNSRRNEVYLGLYAVDDARALNPIGNIVSIHQDDIADHVRASLSPYSKWVVAGEGGTLVAESLKKLHGNLYVIPPYLARPSASALATLGAERHRRGLLDDVAHFEPYYLNAFIPKKRTKSIFDRLPF